MTARVGGVTGHYAGFFTRTVAFLIDWFILIGVYGLMLGGTQFVLNAFFGLNVDFTTGSTLVTVVGFLGWAFIYSVVGLTLRGRAIGKVLVGLTVVDRDGSPIGPRRAAVRTLTIPLSFLLLGLGLLGVLFGRERRALHDVIAGTAVVYDWGDRPAELPAPMTQWLESRGVPVTREPETPAESETMG